MSKIRKEKWFCITRLCRDDFEAVGYDASNVSDEEMKVCARKLGKCLVGWEGDYWIFLEEWAEDKGYPKLEDNNGQS